MQLGRQRPLPDPPDLAAALRAASGSLGHRPAITVLSTTRRDEQGFASLAQWAAKGAHLMEFDLELGPGSRLFVSGRPGWMPAAVCLAAWWAGVAVVTPPATPDAADAGVLHEDERSHHRTDTLWFGDEVDGTPTAVDRDPAYAVEVQAFPDQPPPPSAGGDLLALETAAGRWTQRELIAFASSRWSQDGALGLDVGSGPDPHLWLAATAVRPLLTGHPTVVMEVGVERSAAGAERVRLWAEE